MSVITQLATQSLNTNQLPAASFQLGPAVISDGTNYVSIGTLQIPDAARGKGGAILVHGDVDAAGALNGFKITWASVFGGTHTDCILDGALNTAGDIVIASTVDIYATLAGGAFKLLLGVLPAEIGFWAKKASANTKVTLYGGLT